MTESDSRTTDAERPYQNKEWLIKNYVEGDRSLSDLAESVNVSGRTITRWAKNHDLPLRRPKNETLEERFNRMCERQGPDECWEWNGHIMGTGYAGINWNGSKYGAHRASYILHSDELDTFDDLDEFILHKCHNPGCVNPDHLMEGSHALNMEHAIEAGTFGPMGERHHKAKLTEKDVVEIRRRYETDESLSHRGLADEYGVAKSTMTSILNREYWKHVD